MKIAVATSKKSGNRYYIQDYAEGGFLRMNRCPINPLPFDKLTTQKLAEALSCERGSTHNTDAFLKDFKGVPFYKLKKLFVAEEIDEKILQMTEEEYDQMVKWVEDNFSTKDEEQVAKMEEYVSKIDAYQNLRHPIDPPTRWQAFKFRLEQQTGWDLSWLP